MNKTAVVHARVEPRTKKKAEGVLRKLGMSPTEAIRLFYRQICLRGGLPFRVLIPNDLTRGTLDKSAKGHGVEPFDYEWVSVERYMGIFHEVQPADKALRCLDCHGPDGRLDWAGLGYEADPLAAVLSP